jgi:hypothetical protein
MGFVDIGYVYEGVILFFCEFVVYPMQVSILDIVNDPASL